MCLYNLAFNRKIPWIHAAILQQTYGSHTVVAWARPNLGLTIILKIQGYCLFWIGNVLKRIISKQLRKEPVAFGVTRKRGVSLCGWVFDEQRGEDPAKTHTQLWIAACQLIACWWPIFPCWQTTVKCIHALSKNLDTSLSVNDVK